jgi:glycosyltransferase involved in cell wall biosynthesis
MIISVVLPDNINTASRASKEIISFVKSGHEIKLIYLPPAYAYDEMRNPNIKEFLRIKLYTRKLPKNIFFWVIKYFEFFCRIFYSLVTQKPDLVFCHDLMPLIPCYIYSKIFFKKMIYDAHEIHREILSPFKPAFFWKSIETYIINSIALTFITDYDRLNYMVNNAGVRKEKIKPVFNLPYMDELIEASSKLGLLNPIKKKIIYTGIIMPGRYIDEIIKSIIFWKKDANFYLIGDGDEDYIVELKNLAMSLNVFDRVFFVPPVKWNELVDFIDESDLAFAFYKNNCLNNLYCSPNKLYEALASGTPVIGTANPIIKEVLEELDFGLCLDFDNINSASIGNAVNQIIEKRYTKEYKLSIKTIVRKKFSWESQENFFNNYIKEAINQNN